MNPNPLRFFLPALAALFVLVPSAEAARALESVASASYVTAYHSNNGAFNMGTGDLFDDDLTTGISMNEVGAYLVMDFTGASGMDNDHIMYVDTVTIGHTGNGSYSLEWSEDGTTWNPVAGAENVRTTGSTDYFVANRVKKLKYVTEESSSSVSLTEWKVMGYVSTKPENVVLNKSNLAKMYNPDGTMTANNGTGGFGGGSQLTWLFNGGKKTDGSWVSGITYMPSIGNGGWCLIDFSSVMPGGYFVTSIAITQGNAFKYSLYWSMDGATWNPVDDAIGVSKVGTAAYDVNETAKYVKVLLNETGGWTGNLSEIEVFAMDPEDIACTHPSYTEWTAVEGSATCLLPGVDERFCTVCGARFTREQESALGHDFVSHLLKPGKYRQFGSGYVECSRCGWRLDFPADENDPFATMPLDLVTNRVGGTPIGRVSVKGQFNFTELTVTTTGNGADEPNPDNNWGVNPSALINNLWGWAWHDYWYSMGSDRNPHVDFVFGTEIDLAWIEISVDNNTMSTKFFSVDDDTEAETLLYDWSIEKIADGTIVDETTGEEITVSAPSTQRTTIRFYEQPVKHLRIRQTAANGNTRVPMYISEVHPWGTVKGAGDAPYDKRSIMIFR